MLATAYLEVLGPDEVVIRAHGDFDLATSRTLATALEDAAGSGCDVVLDLERATFLDVYCLRLRLLTREVGPHRGRTVGLGDAPPEFPRLPRAREAPDPARGPPPARRWSGAPGAAPGGADFG